MEIKENRLDDFLGRDADATLNISLCGNELCISSVSRYGPPINRTHKLSKAEMRLMEEMQK